ncbi:MAG: AraC-like DNA-binding protein [Sphingobacteriales bacterium]|jgi:AraC-like DNA-binding protein
MKIYIKNMVCHRCKLVVKSELEKLDFHPLSVELGLVEISESSLNPKKEQLNKKLKELGFEILDTKRSKVIEQIKTLIIDLVHNKNNQLKTNLSTYISAQLNHNYNSLSNLFSETENTTIEKFYINQKIERVKELIIYKESTLSEIAFLLNYSSVAHLSNQFKKVTGFSPSYYKSLKEQKRKQIENL